MTTERRGAEEMVRRLVGLGEEVPEELRREILALGADAVGSLVALVEEEDDPDDFRWSLPWHRVHAACLLADLRAPGGAEVVTRRLEKSHRLDSGDWLWDKLGGACGRFGADLVEPMLAAYARAEAGSGLRTLYAGILSGVGVRDDRLFEIIAAECRGQPSFCDMLGSYGDPRGLELVLRELHNAIGSMPPDAGCWCELQPAFEAVEKLGGELSPELEWVRDTARKAWKRAREKRDRAEGRTRLN